MTLWEISIRSVGSLCSLYCLVHIISATHDPAWYEVHMQPRTLKSPQQGQSKPLSWLNAAVLLVGFVILGSQIAGALFWWMPPDWGLQIDGEFQSYSERLGQGAGGLMGLFGFAFLDVAKRR